MFELYYRVPWPNCQDYMGDTEEEYQDFENHSIQSIEGPDVFIEKEWLDNFKSNK